MKTEHFTPGPWAIKERKKLGEIVSITIENNNILIADIYMSEWLSPQANANLIAAAPIMYAELKKEMQFLDYLIQTVSGMSSVHKIEINNRIAEIEAALSKVNPQSV